LAVAFWSESFGVTVFVQEEIDRRRIAAKSHSIAIFISTFFLEFTIMVPTSGPDAALKIRNYRSALIKFISVHLRQQACHTR
jgi:hypothetical protein